ncbi:MAG: aminotransferase class V-fold PLP-dependent enzyme [Nostocoides sp.]
MTATANPTRYRCFAVDHTASTGTSDTKTPSPLETAELTAQLPPVIGTDLTVPVAGGGHLSYINADHAASAPALLAVERAVAQATLTYSSVHRGQGWASQVTSAHYEAARDEIGRFVGARPDDAVVITRNTTDSLNLLASCLPADAHVVVFSSEHHATLLPWPAERTHRLAVPRSFADAERFLGDALRELPAGAPKLVVLTGASNVTGELWDLSTLIPLVRAHAGRVVLDAAQLAAHRRIDIAALGADWVAFSGHKLYAPYGAGALVGRADWLNQAPPYLAGGGATQAVSDQGTSWATGPARHEAGSPNVLGAIALATACATLAAHHDTIAAHEEELADTLHDGLAAIPGVRTWALFPGASERLAVACFTIDTVDSSLVSAALSAEHGIGVRDGKFCAHLLVDDLLASEKHSTAVRVSLGLGTSLADVQRILAAVRAVATHGPTLDWTHTAAGWSAPEAPVAQVAPLW